MKRAYIGIGSNIGDKKSYISRAITLLSQLPGVRLLRIASLYRSAPVGNTNQDWFLNTVAEVEVSIGPNELLCKLLRIEEQLERVRTIRWGPRTIDLDLLTYENITLNTQQLTLPHPRMHERAFVMAPLAELIPKLKMYNGSTAKELAEKLMLEQDLERLPALDY